MSAQGLNLLVFRDGNRLESGRSLKTALGRQIRLSDNSFQSPRAMEALLRAGELESALADADSGSHTSANITDLLADALVCSKAGRDSKQLLALLEATPVPEQLTLSVPEGFAYYALHPLAFADVLDLIPSAFSRAAVVGIQTIGVTLSAVAAAALRTRGVPASRITVRPTGHPYNRQTRFSLPQMEFVKREIAAGSHFFVVDEGPGLSGSSFLSVAEALVRAGVPRDSITLICSHAPNFNHLCAENAAQRGQQFRWVPVSQQVRRPREAQVWIGAGEWRRHLMPHAPWPPAWFNFERLKYLSPGEAEARFYKFLGLGHYGIEVFEREAELAGSGFAVPLRVESEGFGSYPCMKARPMSIADISESALARLASYCACRLYSFPADSRDSAALHQMAEHNLQQLRFDVPVSLKLEHPVIADGRMQPHEWLLTPTGRMLKTDSGSHGDDHFFPGAVDIAWDLASAIVEWQMDAAARKTFLEIYRRASGDDADKRIADYITAYTVFRCTYCLMGANATQDLEERQRLQNATTFYRARLLQISQPIHAHAAAILQPKMLRAEC